MTMQSHSLDYICLDPVFNKVSVPIVCNQLHIISNHNLLLVSLLSLVALVRSILVNLRKRYQNCINVRILDYHR